MSMRVKTLAILAVLAAAVVVANGLAERAIILPKFLALQRDEAGRNLRRVESALHRDLEQLGRSTRDYAEWDDACRFVEQPSQEFVRSNLAPNIFSTFRLNLIHIYDADRRLVWGQTRDFTDGSPLELAGLGSDGLAGVSALFEHTAPPRSTAGFVDLDGQLLLAASHPIVTSEGRGPVRGTVVFGRLLSEADAKAIRQQTSVEFSLLPAAASGTAAPGPADAEDCTFDDGRGDVLCACAPLRDLSGSVVRVVEAETPRAIEAEGRSLVRSENVCMLGVAAALLLGAYVTFGRFVVGPVRQLTQHVLWVRQSGDLTRRVGMEGSGEVGTLGREFDLLLAQLDRSRAAHLKAEHRLKSVLQEQTELIRRFLPDGTTTFVNRAYARYFGKSEETLLGQCEELPVPDEDRPLVEAHLKVVGRSAPAAEVTHRVVLPGGDVRWLHWTTRAICDRQGRVIELQSVGRDVTDQMARQGRQDEAPRDVEPAICPA